MKTGPRVTLSIYDWSLREAAKEKADEQGESLAGFVEAAIRDRLNGHTEMVGLAEAADILGIRKSNVSKMEASGRAPKRVQTLASGPLWPRHAIEPLGRVLASERAEREARSTQRSA